MDGGYSDFVTRYVYEELLAENLRREERIKAGCQQCGEPVVIMTLRYADDYTEIASFWCDIHARQWYTRTEN
jgi:hypothetical protein